MKLHEVLSKGWVIKGNFPIELCTIENKKEPEILDSDRSFLVLMVDKRFTDTGWFGICLPYTARNLPEEIADGGPEILFGWRYAQFSGYADHFENNIHDDDQVVVAWLPVPSSSDLRDLVDLPHLS